MKSLDVAASVWNVWLLPWFAPLARAASAVYYRVRYTGAPVPRQGPVLLVANHQNSLLDPTLVIAAARRPVRFLAKAPLFTDRKIGWLIRASGAIPVYRRVDDPALMERNEDAFRAAYAALAGGAAVGIFPEGTSHSEPSLVPLKTGAARIALGAHTLAGGRIPIIPVGLVFRQKDVFRSEAVVLTGRAVSWDDLAPRGPDDAEAVRLLTERIGSALRQVTVNLERWEDRPLIGCAVRIWEAERGVPALPAERVARLDVTTRILADVRRRGDPDAMTLARDVEMYCRRLRRLRLRPTDVVADVRTARGVRWAVRRLHLVMPFAAFAAVAGAVLFWVPYRLTGFIVDRIELEEDVRSTWKLLVGTACYLAWVILLAVIVGMRFGLAAGIASLLVVPATGLVGLAVRERWRHAWGDVDRFFLLRSRAELVTLLRERQRALGARLDALYNAFVARNVGVS